MKVQKRLQRDARPALIFLTGELLAVPIPLEREEVILGRAMEADVRINDTGVARRHARINTIFLCMFPVKIGNSKSVAGTGIFKAFCAKVKFFRMTCDFCSTSIVSVKRNRLAGSRKFCLANPKRLSALVNLAIVADFKSP
jgi:hypothetical protein